MVSFGGSIFLGGGVCPILSIQLWNGVVHLFGCVLPEMGGC